MRALSRVAVEREGDRGARAQRTNASGLASSTGGTHMAANLLQLQHLAGNRSVNALLGQNRPSAFATVAGGSIQRTLVQRDDPPDPFKDPTKRPDPITGPGGPGDVGDKSLVCGWKNGKFSCSADIGKGDPADVPGDWSNYGPSKPGQSDLKGPGACPPDKYNKLWMKCCPDGTHVDGSGMNCVQDQLPLLPPPTPEQPGDYPTPDVNPATAVV